MWSKFLFLQDIDIKVRSKSIMSQYRWVSNIAFCKHSNDCIQISSSSGFVSWNAVNRLLKSEMKQCTTSLIQDWMLREQIEAQHQDGSVTVDYKLKCGLNIRISDKRVLWSAWGPNAKN